MNDKKNIENLLKDKLNQQEFDIQDNWIDEMSSMLDDYNDEPKSKKGLFIILAGLALLIGGIGTLFIINKDAQSDKDNLSILENFEQKNNPILKNKNSSQATFIEERCYEKESSKLNTSETEEISISKEKKAILKTKNLKTNKANKNNKVSSNKNYASKSESSFKKNTSLNANNSEQKNSSNQNTLTGNSLKNDDEKKSKIINQKVLESKLLNENSISQEEKITVNKNTNNTSKNKFLVGKNETNNSIKVSKKDAYSTITKAEILAENKIQKNKEKISEEKSFPKDLKTENTNTLISSSEFKKPILKDSIQKELEERLAKDSLIKKEETTVQKTPKKDLGLSVAITGGVSFLFREFDSENSKRVYEESNKISWNTNLEIYKTFKNRLILGTGINITNYGEKINYSALEVPIKDTITTFEENNYINLSLKRVQGVYLFDSTYFTQYDTIKIIKDSTYLNEEITKDNGATNFMYIEIPVKIGYRILETKKFAINAITGVSFGFLIQNQGSYINSENKLAQAESETILFNYLLSADFIYKINNNINFTLSPHFKYNLNNLSTINATKRKYSTFGINGGVILDF